MTSDAEDPPRTGPAVVALVTDVLDPVLEPFGFAPAQGGMDDPAVARAEAAPSGQLIWCRPRSDGAPGCEDVVLDLVADPGWRVQAVHALDDPRGPWTSECAADSLEHQVARLRDDLLTRYERS